MRQGPKEDPGSSFAAVLVEKRKKHHLNKVGLARSEVPEGMLIQDG